MSQSTALASLTATYTDSEGEDESMENEDKDEHEGTVTLPSPSGSGSDANKSSPTNSRPSSPIQVRVTTKVAKLVSYHDDTIASDDENEGDVSIHHHQVIMLTEMETTKTEVLEPIEEDGIQLPPEPPGHCSIDLQDKIMKLYEKMQTQQLDMNALIQKRKDFRNPSIYEKLIQFCSINESGTNYPPAIYDPLKWSKESYYEELAKVQKVEMDRREKERKSKVEFVSGTKKQDDDAKKRKSKWDQPGGNTVSSHIKPAGLVQPSLTNSATGTKGTVISAFGSLPKKPRL